MRIVKGYNSKYFIFIFFSVIFVTLKIVGRNHIFFWDTVQLGSLHAHWFYENNFSELLLPNKWDSGHIPVFGMYLAFVWELFGKTLTVTHLSMLPFIIGIIWQLVILSSKYIQKNYVFFATLILLAEPVLCTQMLLISPDVWLIFFFLLALNAILSNKKILLSIAVAGLILTSQRGMLTAFSLFLGEIIVQFINGNKARALKDYLKKIYAYIPGTLIGGSYLIWHFLQKKWIGYHEDSPWSGSFQLSGFAEIIKNILILGWRLLDFGKLFIVLTLLFLTPIVLKLLKKEKHFFTIRVFVFLITFLLIISPVLVTHKSLLAHRYLLPAYVLINFLFLIVVFQLKNRIKRNILVSIAFLALITGNLWIYPDTVAMGWDSTLAHMPYYNLREKMVDYMETNNIPIEKTGTVFPNAAKFKYLNLTTDNKQFTDFNLQKNKYVFQSNVFNDIPDSSLYTLKTKWTLLKEYKKRGIYVRLYKMPDTF